MRRHSPKPGAGKRVRLLIPVRAKAAEKSLGVKLLVEFPPQQSRRPALLIDQIPTPTPTCKSVRSSDFRNHVERPAIASDPYNVDPRAREFQCALINPLGTKVQIMMPTCTSSSVARSAAPTPAERRAAN